MARCTECNRGKLRVYSTFVKNGWRFRYIKCSHCKDRTKTVTKQSTLKNCLQCGKPMKALRYTTTGNYAKQKLVCSCGAERVLVTEITKRVAV